MSRLVPLLHPRLGSQTSLSAGGGRRTVVVLGTLIRVSHYNNYNNNNIKYLSTSTCSKLYLLFSQKISDNSADIPDNNDRVCCGVV